MLYLGIIVAYSGMVCLATQIKKDCKNLIIIISLVLMATGLFLWHTGQEKAAQKEVRFQLMKDKKVIFVPNENGRPIQALADSTLINTWEYIK